MKEINKLVIILSKLEKQLKTSKINPKTEHIIYYEISNTLYRINQLSDVINMDNISNNIIGGCDIILPEVEKVRELAEQHYNEENGYTETVEEDW